MGESDKRFLMRLKELIEIDRELSELDVKRFTLIIIDRLLRTWMKGESSETSENLNEVIADLRKRKDQAYSERNICVALLAKFSYELGLNVGTALHDIQDKDWDKDWRTIIYIDLPKVGQVSWHLHDSQVQLVQELPPYNKTWDGHTTEEKYDRIAKYIRDK